MSLFSESADQMEKKLFATKLNMYNLISMLFWWLFWPFQKKLAYELV